MQVVTGMTRLEHPTTLSAPSHGRAAVVRVTAMVLLAALCGVTLMSTSLAPSERTSSTMRWVAWRRVGRRLSILEADTEGAARLAEQGFLVEPSLHVALVDPLSIRSASEDEVTPPLNVPADGSRIAVIDTGANPQHRWLTEHIVAAGDFTGVIGGVPGLVATNSSTEQPSWTDAHGHGTHVAGIVRLNNPSARLIIAKALDDRGRGDSTWIARAITWSVDMRADVINLSLGTIENSRVLRDAVAMACSRGVIVVAAAGNFGHEGSPRTYPAAFPCVTAVAATDDASAVTYFSNRGDYVDLAAEGDSVISASHAGGVVAMSGTSMSAPKVAAVLGLVKNARPLWTTSQIIDHVRATAIDRGPQGPDGAYGFGSVNADFALAADQPIPLHTKVTLPQANFVLEPVVGGVKVIDTAGTVSKLRVLRVERGSEVNVTPFDVWTGCWCFHRNSGDWLLTLDVAQPLVLRAEDDLGIPFVALSQTLQPVRLRKIVATQLAAEHGRLVQVVRANDQVPVAFFAFEFMMQWKGRYGLFRVDSTETGAQPGEYLVKLRGSSPLFACYLNPAGKPVRCTDVASGRPVVFPQI